MRRPHRTIIQRIGRRAEVIARQLPAPLRLRARRLTFRVGRDADGAASLAELRTGQAPALRLTGALIDPEVVSSFDHWAHLVELADTASAVLSAAGIEHVRATRARQETIAVPLEQRQQALAVLHAATDHHWWLRADVPNDAGLPAADRRALAFPGQELRLFRRLVSPEGRHVAGGREAISLQFWETVDADVPRPDGGMHQPGTRVAPGRNDWAAYISRDSWEQAQREESHRLRAAAFRQILEIHEPIDLVYTWVDDTDPAWLERRASVKPDPSQLAADALDPARTRDDQQLRYSLRSAARYASWARHIWIVTDDQVPAWLDTAAERITVVPHTAIFTEPDALPTFNSHAIESQLHHIPGLADRYLYLNDDFFFGSPVRPERFFHGNGVPKFMLSPIPVDRDLSAESRNGAMLAARQGRALMERTFARTVTHRMQHVPHAHLRSSLDAFEAQFPELVDQVAHSRFRSNQDYSIASDLAHYYAYARDEAVTDTVSFRYIDVGSPMLAEHLENLLVHRDVSAFCLNDVGDYDDDIDYALVSRFLAAYFPLPGPFEIAGA